MCIYIYIAISSVPILLTTLWLSCFFPVWIGLLYEQKLDEDEKYDNENGHDDDHDNDDLQPRDPSAPEQ